MVVPWPLNVNNQDRVLPFHRQHSFDISSDILCTISLALLLLRHYDGREGSKAAISKKIPLGQKAAVHAEADARN